MNDAGGLTRIKVIGLFGSRDYIIEMSNAAPTVLTGANGTGKSTILRLVNAASSGDLKAFVYAPVTRFELSFRAMAPFSYEQVDSQRHVFNWGDNSFELAALQVLDRLPEWAQQAIQEAPASYLSGDMDELITAYARSADIPFSEYRSVRNLLRHNRLTGSTETPEWFQEFGANFPALFVTDQRLVVDFENERKSISPRLPRKDDGHESRTTRLAVEAASLHVRELMQNADSAYARASQTEDRQFPRAVIRAMNSGGKSPREYLDSLARDVDMRRRQLREVGLLDRDEEFEPDLAVDTWIGGQVEPVISTFLESALRKLKVLEELSERLRAFKSFLDGRFTGKSVVLDRRDGIRFSIGEDVLIRPSQLSSGEQQMMILSYEILFRSREGTLVIVDEPEISLHVLWQDTLIEKLSEMGAASRIQFLMATHSPSLLASHPELERSLDELN